MNAILLALVDKPIDPSSKRTLAVLSTFSSAYADESGFDKATQYRQSALLLHSTPKSTTEAQVMLNELNVVELKTVVLPINRVKAQFMNNSRCNGEEVELDGFSVTENTLGVHLGHD
uniref:SERPIN domain-containing protein n=1 Tax=Angiostrongylus cantonensis TaxID=6313 RepID=A0A0K0D5D6_ANGCA